MKAYVGYKGGSRLRPFDPRMPDKGHVQTFTPSDANARSPRL
jgi:hypothetical protein